MVRAHKSNCCCAICNAKRGVKYGFQKGCRPWNLGKTKQDDPRVAQTGNRTNHCCVVDEWVSSHPPVFCQCRCGEEIQILPHHRYAGVPQYKHGHNPTEISEEGRRRIGEANSVLMQHLWSTDVYAQKQHKAIHSSPNKIEILLQSILDEHFPGEWKFVGDGQLIVAGKCPDFVHTSRPLLIELFGDYWHSEEVTGVPSEHHEKDRIQLFEAEGYRTLVVWEQELEDVVSLVVCIHNFMES